MLFISLTAVVAPAAPRPAASVVPTASPTHPHVRRPPIAREDLFSLRARRRFAAYLRMRLLEMREEGLERAAAAVERSRPVEELLAPQH